MHPNHPNHWLPSIPIAYQSHPATALHPFSQIHAASKHLPLRLVEEARSDIAPSLAFVVFSLLRHRVLLLHLDQTLCTGGGKRRRR